MGRRAPSAPGSAPSAPVDSYGDLSVGTRIEHLKFGRGTITGIDTSAGDVRITVDFSGAVKTLLLKFAKFTVIND